MDLIYKKKYLKYKNKYLNVLKTIPISDGGSINARSKLKVGPNIMFIKLPKEKKKVFKKTRPDYNMSTNQFLLADNSQFMKTLNNGKKIIILTESSGPLGSTMLVKLLKDEGFHFIVIVHESKSSHIFETFKRYNTNFSNRIGIIFEFSSDNDYLTIFNQIRQVNPEGLIYIIGGIEKDYSKPPDMSTIDSNFSMLYKICGKQSFIIYLTRSFPTTVPEDDCKSGQYYIIEIPSVFKLKSKTSSKSIFGIILKKCKVCISNALVGKKIDNCIESAQDKDFIDARNQLKDIKTVSSDYVARFTISLINSKEQPCIWSLPGLQLDIEKIKQIAFFKFKFPQIKEYESQEKFKFLTANPQNNQSLKDDQLILKDDELNDFIYFNPPILNTKLQRRQQLLQQQLLLQEIRTRQQDLQRQQLLQQQLHQQEIKTRQQDQQRQQRQLLREQQRQEQLRQEQLRQEQLQKQRHEQIKLKLQRQQQLEQQQLQRQQLQRQLPRQ
jgi:hypothetical protein